MKKLICLIALIATFAVGCGTSYKPINKGLKVGVITYKGLTYTTVKLVGSKEKITLEDSYPENNVGDTIKWYDYSFEY